MLEGAVASPAPTAAENQKRVIMPQAADRRQMIMRKIEPRAAQDIVWMGLVGADLVIQHDLWRNVEDTWGRLGKNTHELRSAVCALDFVSRPYCEEGKEPTATALARAALLDEVLETWAPAPDGSENGFRDCIYDVTDAVGKGLSVQEILWERRPSGLIAPRATAWVHPRYYGIQATGTRLQLRPAGPGGSFIDIPPNQFLIGVYKNRSGTPLGYGFYRQLVWWWCAMMFGRDWLLAFSERFGQPFRWANVDPEAGDEVFREVNNMLEQLGAAGYGCFPTGSTVQYIEARADGANSPNERLIALANTECDTVVLGQTLTTDTGSQGSGSGSKALGEVHLTVRDERVRGIGSWAADTLNYQFVPALMRLNFGDDTECPSIVVREQDETPLDKANRFKIILESGVPLPKTWVYEELQVPEPKDGEAVITGPGQAGPGSGAGGAATDPTKQADPTAPQTVEAAAAPSLLPDAVNEIVTAAVAECAGAKRRWLEPVTEQINALVAAARNGSVSDEAVVTFAASVMKSLPDVFVRMDINALSESINSALGAAAVKGIAQGAVGKGGGNA